MSKVIQIKDYEIFAKIMKHLRSEAKVTQIDLAKKLKVQQSFISKYESNDRKLDVLEFLKICQILNKNSVDVINDILSKINL